MDLKGEAVKTLITSVRMTLRDWRSGQLRVLALALVLAVAAVTSVGFLVDRMRAGLQRDAAQLLGADLVVSSDTPIDAGLLEQASDRGLSSAQTVTFPSMAISVSDRQATALVAVKAVSQGYPLRGVLQIKSHVDAAQVPAQGVPARGTVWVDAQLLQALHMKVGDALQLGDARFQVERVISLEPDRGMAFINFAPRVMLSQADLPATGLIQPASRVTYRLLVAGERSAVRAFSAQIGPTLVRGQRIESLDAGRPEMQRTLERAERFLALVALLAALVAAVAVAAAARRFTARHLDSCAVMRCLGLVQREIAALFVLEFLWIGLMASVLGVCAGFGLHFALLKALGSLVPVALPGPTVLPALQGLATGLIVLLTFALPPLAQLRHVPPLRVLRKDLGPPGRSMVLGHLLGLAGFVGLLLWAAGDIKLGLLAAGGFAGGIVLFGAAGSLMLLALRPLRAMTGRLGITWRFAAAAMQRRPTATVVQLVMLAVGLMALLLLTVIRTDLVNAWRRATPADAPNRFIINIQPDQQRDVAQRLHEVGVSDVSLHPMIRGRLIAINGNAVNPDHFDNDRAQRLVDREFNLSYAAQAPAHNTLIAGHWFEPQAQELSIEEGIAKTLNVKLGDELTFLIAGERVSARTTSVRKVSWDSMRANFFVIMSPGLLAHQPQSFMSAFHLPANAVPVQARLLSEFPNLTFIDTSAVFAQVQSVLNQVIAAVEFIFVFTLLAGLLVLYAALSATHDERVREAALLRALGASRAQLARVQTTEMLFLGGLAGLLAAVGAGATGWMLARESFDFSYVPDMGIFVVAIVSGCISALAGGWWSLRTVLNTPPIMALREA